MAKRRYLTGVAVVSMLAFLIAGCGGTPAKSNNGGALASNNTTSSATKEITVYNTNVPDRKFIRQLSDEFQKIHKDIKVKVIDVPFDNFDSKLQTMLASNTPPDITTHLGWAGFAEYLSKDQLLDLSPYMDNFDASQIGIPDELMKIYQVNGKQYAIPLESYVTFMLYNKDMFDKAGLSYPPADYNNTSWTWDKMLEDAKKLTIDSKNINQAQYGLLWAWSGGGNEQDPQYFGHDVFPPETFTTGNGMTSKNFFNNPDVSGDIQKLGDLVWKDKVSPPPSFVKGMGDSDLFLAGKVAMVVDGSWRISGINNVNFKVGVAAIPMGGNSKVRDVLWTNGFWIFKGSKHPKEAFEWIKFMAQKENQEKMVEISAGDPPANSLALDKYTSFFKGINSSDLKNVINGSLQYGAEGFSHLMPGSQEMHTLINNELSPVFDGSKKASDVTPGLEHKLNDLLGKIQAKYKK